MNIKEMIEELVEKIMDNKDLMTKFQKDPVGTIEGLIGIDLPNDEVEKVVAAVKAKIGLEKLEDKIDDLDDKLEDKLGGVLGGALGGLFGKK